MYQVLKKINGLLTKVEKTIGTVAIFLMFILILAGCISRYLFNSPIKWVEEVTNLLLIWMGFLAVCYSTASQSHVSIDFITRKMPEKFRFIWYAVLQAIIVITFVLILPVAVKSVKYQITTPALNISLKAMFTVVPISCGLLIYHSMVNIIGLLRKAAGKEA